MSEPTARPAPPRRQVLVVLTVTVVAVAVATWLKSWCGVGSGDGAALYLGWCYSDVPPLFFAERLHEGAVPYLDHPVEYPVLTGLWMWLAALPATTVGGFFAATVVLLLAAAVVVTVLLVREVGPGRALVYAAAPTLAISAVVNWDLPAVAFATAGLVAHRRGRDGLAGTMLGLGTAAKLYPGLFLLAVVPAAWRLRGRRAGLTTALTAAVAWWAVNAPVALAAPEAWQEFLRLNRTRGPDWDSLYTLADRLGGPTLSASTANLVSAAALATIVAVLAVVAVRRVPAERWHLLTLPLLIGFLLVNKVYSPQFSLWLLPLLALAPPRPRWLAAFAVADVAVTATRFPYLAGFVGGGIDGAIGYAPFGAAVAARAAVLLVIAVLAVRRAAAPDGPDAPVSAPPDVTPAPA
jgi:uncharacterized membrane protein